MLESDIESKTLVIDKNLSGGRCRGLLIFNLLHHYLILVFSECVPSSGTGQISLYLLINILIIEYNMKLSYVLNNGPMPGCYHFFVLSLHLQGALYLSLLFVYVTQNSDRAMLLCPPLPIDAAQALHLSYVSDS